MRGRTGFTEAPGTVAGGHLLLLSGGSNWSDRGLSRTDVGEMSLRLRLVNRLELRLSPNSYCTKSVGGVSQSGVLDASFNLKALVLTGRPTPGLGLPALAVSAGSSVPNGSQQFSAERWQPFVRVMAERKLTSRLTVMANVTWSDLAITTGRRQQLAGTAWVGWQQGRRVWFWMEHYLVAPLGVATPDARYLHGGMTVGVGPNTSFDLHVGAGLNEPALGRVLGIGMAQRW
jgi:hypothetical protein